MSSTVRFLALVGLALGAIYGLTNSWLDLLVALLLTVIGAVVGLVLDGRIAVDLDELTGRGDQRRT